MKTGSSLRILASAAALALMTAAAPAQDFEFHGFTPTGFSGEMLSADGGTSYARTPGGQHVYAMWLVWDTAVRTEQGWQQARQGLDQLLNQASAAVLEADAA